MKKLHYTYFNTKTKPIKSILGIPTPRLFVGWMIENQDCSDTSCNGLKAEMLDTFASTATKNPNGTYNVEINLSLNIN